MIRQTLCALFFFCALASLASCSANQNNPTPAPNLPNPASVHCEQNGGKLELRQDPTGGVAGICVFRDGSECDEWAYFRGECKTGEKGKVAEPSSSPRTEAARAASAELESDGWKVYRDLKFGYILRYPPDAAISNADDPLGTLTITGPLIGNDHWPVINLSHPNDREDYRPPEGVDLEKWLTDH